MVEPVVLAVGDPFRGRVRTTLVVSLGGVVVFMAFAWVTTQAQSVRAHSPWQDDPYDLVVSFAGIFVPLLAGAAMARAWLCRRSRPLPAARVRDLLRAAWLVSLSITVTVVADWVAVILGVHRAEWDGPGGLLIGALAILTVSAAVLLVTVRATGRAAPWRAFPAHPADPDWLDDLLAVATEATRMLGPLGPLARRLLGRGVAWFVEGRRGVRRYPLAGAAVLACLTGLALGTAEAVGEGAATLSGASVQVGVFALIGAAGMFAFLVAAGAYLHFLRPASDRSGRRWGRIATRTAFASATSIPLAVGFRGQIAWLTGGALSDATLAGFLLIIGAAAALTAAVTLTVQLALARPVDKAGST